MRRNQDREPSYSSHLEDITYSLLVSDPATASSNFKNQFHPFQYQYQKSEKKNMKFNYNPNSSGFKTEGNYETPIASAIRILRKLPLIHDKEIQVLESYLNFQTKIEDNFEQEDIEDTILALNVSASLYSKQKEYTQAEQILNYAYEVCVLEKVSKQQLSTTLMNSAIISSKSNNINKALEAIEKCISIGNSHQDTITAYKLKSTILRRQAKFEESIGAAKSGLSIAQYQQKQQNESSESTLEVASCLYTLGVSKLANQSESYEGISHLSNAVQISQKILGYLHPTTIKYKQKYQDAQQQQQNQNIQQNDNNIINASKYGRRQMKVSSNLSKVSTIASHQAPFLPSTFNSYNLDSDRSNSQLSMLSYYSNNKLKPRAGSGESIVAQAKLRKESYDQEMDQLFDNARSNLIQNNLKQAQHENETLKKKNAYLNLKSQLMNKKQGQMNGMIPIAPDFEEERQRLLATIDQLRDDKSKLENQLKESSQEEFKIRLKNSSQYQKSNASNENEKIASSSSQELHEQRESLDNKKREIDRERQELDKIRLDVQNKREEIEKQNEDLQAKEQKLIVLVEQSQQAKILLEQAKLSQSANMEKQKGALDLSLQIQELLDQKIKIESEIEGKQDVLNSLEGMSEKLRETEKQVQEERDNLGILKSEVEKSKMHLQNINEDIEERKKENETIQSEIQSNKLFLQTQPDGNAQIISPQLSDAQNFMTQKQVNQSENDENCSFEHINQSIDDIKENIDSFITIYSWIDGSALSEFKLVSEGSQLICNKDKKEIFCATIDKEIPSKLYSSSNVFILILLLRNLCLKIVSLKSGNVFPSEASAGLQEMEITLIGKKIKFSDTYLKEINLIEDHIKAALSSFSFFSKDSPQKNILIMKENLKKKISFGVRYVSLEKSKEQVSVNLTYDIIKQSLIIEQPQNILLGMKVPIKKEDVQKWMVQHNLLSLDGSIRAIKLSHVKLLKSSIKRYLLARRVFSAYIGIHHQGQRINGILSLYKGKENIFLCLRTIHKTYPNRKFFEIPQYETSFEKIVTMMKQIVIDHCEFSFSLGIVWIHKNNFSNVFPKKLSNIILNQLFRIQIHQIINLKHKDYKQFHLEEQLSQEDDDIIRVIVTQISEEKISISTLWDLPIKSLELLIQPNLSPKDLKAFAIESLSKVTIVAGENGKLSFVQLQKSLNIQMSEDDQETNLFELNLLNANLRRYKQKELQGPLQLIDAIEVPDHVTKGTCKLQIILDKDSQEYQIRSQSLKSVKELRIPAYNLPKEKLLQIYFFYFDAMKIGYIKRSTLERAVFQMKRFMLACRLRFYQLKTKRGQFGDLVLFQGKGEDKVLLILKVYYTSRKDMMRKLIIIRDSNLQLVVENVNQLVKITDTQVEKIYEVLSYRQIENQYFQFFRVAALWQEEDREIILKPDDPNIKTQIFKKGRLSYKQALFQGQELLQQAILYQDPKTGINAFDE